jgi:membrane protein implicated in regulation of membrane protease activity
MTPYRLVVRVVYALACAALFVLAFFFLTVALIAGAIVALVVIGRLWWLSRKLSRTQEQTEIEGEFTVVERHDPIKRMGDIPPESGSL